MIKKIILVVPLLIIFSAEISLADSSEKKPLEILKNRLASVKDRLNAMESLKVEEDSEIVDDLIHIVSDSEDSIVVRGHVIELLSTLKDPIADMKLNEIMLDKFLSAEVRRLAVYALWKKDPEKIMPRLINLVQDSSEPADLRLTALSYLGQIKGTYPPGFWKNLFLRKDNPVPLRIVAMNGMETLELLEEERDAFLQVLENPNEPFELRKSVILTAGRAFLPSEFQMEMISLISKTQNSPEIRRFAVDNLGAQADQALLPQLKDLAAREKDRIVLEELNSLVNNISPKQ